MSYGLNRTLAVRLVALAPTCVAALLLFEARFAIGLFSSLSGALVASFAAHAFARRIDAAVAADAVLASTLLAVGAPWWVALGAGALIGASSAAPPCSGLVNTGLAAAALASLVASPNVLAATDGVHWLTTSQGQVFCDSAGVLALVGCAYLCAKGRGRIAAPLGLAAAFAVSSLVAGAAHPGLFRAGLPVIAAYVLSDERLHPRTDVAGFAMGAVVGVAAVATPASWGLWAAGLGVPAAAKLIARSRRG